MTRSESINELAAALAKAQADMDGAKKANVNPHFKSKYADLSSVRDACNAALTKYGLSVAQWPRLVAAGEGTWLVEVETTLLHASGQWMADTLAVPVTKVDAQGVGSAITYARRYALAAVSGVAPEDDDGNAAVGTNGQKTQQQAQVPALIPPGFSQWFDDLHAAADNGKDALRAAWEAAKPELRRHLTSAHPNVMAKLKKQAEDAKVPA